MLLLERELQYTATFQACRQKTREVMHAHSSKTEAGLVLPAPPASRPYFFGSASGAGCAGCLQGSAGGCERSVPPAAAPDASTTGEAAGVACSSKPSNKSVPSAPSPRPTAQTGTQSMVSCQGPADRQGHTVRPCISKWLANSSDEA